METIATRDIPVDALTPEQLRAELTFLRIVTSYECCCIYAGCDCYSKRDAAWRAIPGNYPCPECCDDDCVGGTDCGTDCKAGTCARCGG